jgi:hypothetical protein
LDEPHEKDTDQTEEDAHVDVDSARSVPCSGSDSGGSRRVSSE